MTASSVWKEGRNQCRGGAASEPVLVELSPGGERHSPSRLPVSLGQQRPVGVGLAPAPVCSSPSVVSGFRWLFSCLRVAEFPCKSFSVVSSPPSYGFPKHFLSGILLRLPRAMEETCTRTRAQDG